MGLYKVWLTVHCRNIPAINAYTALGFSVEGILRGEFILHGDRITALYMGILREDFSAKANSAMIGGGTMNCVVLQPSYIP